MGSSILASLSEAGGNDPFLPISGPLPPHGPVGADRVGTRPTHGHMQLGGPNCAWAVTSQVPIFNHLTHLLEKSDRHQPRSRTSSEPLSRIGVGCCFRYSNLLHFAMGLSYSLSAAHACCIMERGRLELE
jgi:hypothetical protein